MPVAVNADNANMVGSIFHNVNLTGVSLEDVNMSKAKLRHITFAGAQFHDVDMSEVEMTACQDEKMIIDGVPVKDLIAAYRKDR